MVIVAITQQLWDKEQKISNCVIDIRNDGVP